MKSYFPDINVWIALAYGGHQHHTIAVRWFDRLKADTAGFCRLTQLGFLRLLTHPLVMRDEARTQTEAWKVYDRLTSDERIVFYPELDLDAIDSEFRVLTTSARSSPQQWPDAYLAAFARTGNLILVTLDRALSKLAGPNALLLK